MLSHVNALALMRVTLGGFLGFDWSAGLSFRLMGSGSASRASSGIGVGSDAEVAINVEINAALDPVN